MASTAPTSRPTMIAAHAQPFSLRDRLLALPRAQKRMLQITVDIVLIWSTLWLAFYLRLDGAELIEPFGGHAWLFLLAQLLTLPLFVRFGLYRAVMRYVGYQALMSIACAITISALLLALAIYLYNDPPALIPRSVVVIYWVCSLLFIGGLRLLMRQYFSKSPLLKLPAQVLSRHMKGSSAPQTKVAIYGAGAAGNQLLSALRFSHRMVPVAFIDDNIELKGQKIAGLPVYEPNDLTRLIRDTGTQEVLLALPSASRARRNKIITILAPYPLLVRTVPGIMDLASGQVSVDDLREVDIGDLLGRDPVLPNTALFERCIRKQVVMVTGAGGSIGSELCRQIARSEPQTLILFEQSEFALYRIQSEFDAYLRSTGLTMQLVPILGSVRNQGLLFNVMSLWRVDTVYHAAAYKHVPMVERNNAEGIINNTFGTLYSAQAALQAGVSNFVLISTDKAVRPTNIMGCTKRIAELVLQALSAQVSPRLYGDTSNLPVRNRTRFTMVRFGNVLGSSGSVIPLFKKQIRAGGPVTVTHRNITRYFMTIPEAAQLVIQAGAMGEGGDVFVLDMGEPIKIAQLAEKMISLSGLSVRSDDNPDGDIAIEFTGLRPGEKLYEELLIGGNVTVTEHPMIMRANETRLDWEALKAALFELAVAVKDDNHPRISALLKSLVDGYTPDKEIVDWIYRQHASGKHESAAHPDAVAVVFQSAYDDEAMDVGVKRHEAWGQTPYGV
ncbi:polysaccharide biosynthesis protein [Parapusillimonas sp. JC17]|uniref:polysaccharide biosynthesis protein n=1 Tax=Parapusillimonas sp. JC17 TaxID=3445768 RepID=UPI003FA09042